MATGKRGLKRGLAARERTVTLMLDETIITETPPLYAGYGRRGEQVCVPITGNHARRILHGVLNVQSGEVLLLITQEWVQETHQAFLLMIRSHWRGWNIVLFEDRGSPHVATESLRLAKELHIELRFLPKATSELKRHGPSLATGEGAWVGQSHHTVYRGIRGQRMSVYS